MAGKFKYRAHHASTGVAFAVGAAATLLLLVRWGAWDWLFFKTIGLAMMIGGGAVALLWLIVVGIIEASRKR